MDSGGSPGSPQARPRPPPSTDSPPGARLERHAAGDPHDQLGQLARGRAAPGPRRRGRSTRSSAPWPPPHRSGGSSSLICSGRTRTRARPLPAPLADSTASAPSAVSRRARSRPRPRGRWTRPRNWASSTSPGRAVQRRRGVQLGDDALAQHGHLVGHGERLVLVVRHQDGGRPRLAQHVEDVGPDGGAHGGVERREGLVEQHDLGLDGQGPGQRDPLLLAPRELVRVTPAVARTARRVRAARPPGARGRGRGADRRRRCARRSGAGTARPPAGRSRCAAVRWARTGGRRRRRPPPRAGPRRRRASRTRPRSAATWSCRCPTPRESP